MGSKEVSTFEPAQVALRHPRGAAAGNRPKQLHYDLRPQYLLDLLKWLQIAVLTCVRDPPERERKIAALALLVGNQVLPLCLITLGWSYIMLTVAILYDE